MNSIQKYSLSFLFALSLGQPVFSQEYFAENELGLVEGFFATPMVAAELDLTDEQAVDWSELRKRLRKHFLAYTETLNPLLPRGGITDEKKKVFRDKLKGELDIVSEFLVPQQRKRLAQLALRYKVRLTKGKEFFPELSVLIAQDDTIKIQVLPENREKLREAKDKFEEELREMLLRHRREIRELSEMHESAALQLMTPENQEKFNELLGPNVNFRAGAALVPRQKKNNESK